MSYSGSIKAKTAREHLGSALAALQSDPKIPSDVLSVTQNIAQAVGALFEAERAADEKAGKAAVRKALGSLSQTMALLQDVRSQHGGIDAATAAIAGAMSQLHSLTAVSSVAPPPTTAAATRTGPREAVEANLGAASESNFYVGFSGDIGDGGVFIATYNVLELGTGVRATVHLPGGLEFTTDARVHFVRDPMDMSADSEPGMGVRFEGLPKEARELAIRYIKKRAPIFYDD